MVSNRHTDIPMSEVPILSNGSGNEGIDVIRCLHDEKRGDSSSSGRRFLTLTPELLPKDVDRGFLQLTPEPFPYRFVSSDGKTGSVHNDSNGASSSNDINRTLSGDRKSEKTAIDDLTLSPSEKGFDKDKEQLKQIIFEHVLDYDANERAGRSKPADKHRRLEEAALKRKKFERTFEHYFREDYRYRKKLHRLDRFYRKDKKTMFEKFISYFEKKWYKASDKKYIAKVHLAFEERRTHIERNSRKYLGMRLHYRLNWEQIKTQKRAEKIAQMENKIAFDKVSLYEKLEKINQDAIHRLETEGKRKGMTDAKITQYKIFFERESKQYIEQREQEWRMMKTRDIMNRHRTISDLAFTNQYVSIIGYAVTIALAGAVFA